jgi:hypothetical protein
MVNFLDNDDSIIKQELMTYYHFRANLLKHINDRLHALTPQGSEFDYCTIEGQIKELNNILEYVKSEGRHTVLSKLTESTNKEKTK